MKAQALDQLRVALGCPRQRRSKLAQQQARAGDIALVHLVAHRQPARDQRLQGDAARFAQRPSERRPQDLADPTQPVEHLGIVAAEPHDLAEPLIDRAIGSISESLVLDHQERLTCGRQAGHRADRAMVMVGMKRECTGSGFCRGVVEILGPPLEHRDAHDGAAHGAAHPLPSDRRSGMQDHAIRELRNGLRCRNDIDQDRLAGDDAPQGFLIGLIDALQGLSSGSRQLRSLARRLASRALPPAGGLHRT